MDQQKREKLTEMFKTAIIYEEINLLRAQNDCMDDWQKIFRKPSKEKERGEDILNKLILDSTNHALIFANLILKMYEF